MRQSLGIQRQGPLQPAPRLPLAHPVQCRLRFSNKINLNSLFQVSRSFKSGFPVHGPATGFPNRQISLAPSWPPLSTCMYCDQSVISEVTQTESGTWIGGRILGVAEQPAAGLSHLRLRGSPSGKPFCKTARASVCRPVSERPALLLLLGKPRF